MQNLYSDDDSIFVSIASYRDPELQHTLQDIFKKAKRPENIFIGICHQYNMQDDSDARLFQIPFPRPNQLRIENIHHLESKGVGWARSQIQKLWQGEKWFLTIDSHMRFEENWDETCVISCKDLIDKGHKPLLTTAVCGYEIGQELRGHTPNSRVFFSHEGVARTTGGYALNLSAPIHHALFSAGFSFTLSDVRNIPYDPFIFFLGEEITTAIRLWTSGYDLFVPHRIIIFHLYNPIGVGQQDRALVWDDNPAINKRDAISKERVLHITGTKISSNPEALQDIEKYSHGNVRTLRDYERFSGLDFRNRKIREHSKQGLFEEWQEVSNIEKVKNIFAKSTNNSQVKPYFDAIKQHLQNISSILEIQCGNRDEIANNQLISDKNLRYIGVNISEEIIRDNCKYFAGEENKTFITLDASNEFIPKADLVVCLDVAPYLPIANIWSLLENIRDSESEYFIFDSYDEKINDLEINSDNSQKRSINLSQAPFYFPEPILKISGDEDHHFISLYKISDIAFFMDWHRDKMSKLRREIFDKMEVSFAILKSAFSEIADGEKLLQEMMLRITADIINDGGESYRNHSSYQEILNHEMIKDHADKIFLFSCGSWATEIEKLSIAQALNNEVDDIIIRWVRIISKDYIKWKLGLSPFIVWDKGR